MENALQNMTVVYLTVILPLSNGYTLYERSIDIIVRGLSSRSIPKREQLCDRENIALWNKVWSLNVPSKAKHLLWRMSEDLLPDSTIIHNQMTMVPNGKVCLSCDSMDGGYTHTLLRCEYARAVWFGCPLGMKVHEIPDVSLSVLATVLCEKMDDESLALWAMVAWGIWYNRQIRCQSNIGYDPIELIEKMVGELEEFQKRNSYAKSLNMLAFRKAIWAPPPTGWVKINCSLRQFSSYDFGIGCVIRNDMWDVLGSFVKRLRPEEQEEIETTIFEGLMFGLSMGFRSIILEIDHKEMVQKVQSEHWKISREVERIKEIPPEDFTFYVYHISSDDNRLARSVARIAEEFSKWAVWIDELPLGVTNKDMV
ncbi:reverse transcriptase [Tanacetum coccineum]